MGYRVYVNTVLGFAFGKHEVTKEVTVRGCRHAQDTTHKFCSECGKPMWKTEKRAEDFESLKYNVVEGGGSDSTEMVVVGKTLGDLQAPEGSLVHSQVDVEWINSDGTSAFESALRADLEGLGFDMTDRKFALHTVLFESY